MQQADSDAGAADAGIREGAEQMQDNSLGHGGQGSNTICVCSRW